MPARSRGLTYATRASLAHFGLIPELPALKTKLKKGRRNLNTQHTEREILNSLIPHQRQFCQDFEHKYIALCGGYGCLAAGSLVDVWNGTQYIPTPVEDLLPEKRGRLPLFVKTLAGPALASPSYIKGHAPLYRVRLRGGQEFVATKDHLLLSPAGWAPVGRLAEGSLVAIDDTVSDRHCNETTKGYSRSDRRESHSYGELQNPWEVFVQDWFQQLVSPNIGHYRNQFGFPSSGDCARQSVRPWILANRAFGERIAASFPEPHTALQFLLHQHWSADILLSILSQQPPASLTLSSSPQDYEAVLSRASCKQFHTDGLGNWSNTPLRLPEGFQVSLCEAVAPTEMAALGACGPSGRDTRSKLSNRPLWQFQNPCDLAGVGEGFDRQSRDSTWQAFDSGLGLPYSTFSPVESVTPVDNGIFYDLHVPVLNHYFANGVLHHNSGKSWAAVAKSILLSFRSPGYTGIFLEPTIPLLRDVAIPTWEKFLAQFNIPHEFRSSPLPNYILKIPGGDTPIFLRSLENVERLIGVNAAWVMADEIDTVKEDIAYKAIVKLQGRVRVGNCRQLGFATTPEGYRFMHTFFVRESSPEKFLIRAKTTDNPYLDPDFAENLRKQYPPQLVESYLNGEFVNLATATVFAEYNRHNNKTAVVGPDHDELVVVGADFNIGRSMSIYGVIRSERGVPVLHIFGEHQANDTFSLAQYLRRQYTNQILLKNLLVYPDASGGRMQTSSTTTDHDILRDAGLRVITERKNPPIQETIQHTNALLHNAQIRINTATCPNLVACCEEWGYDDSLKPEKGTGSNAHDHVGDALRYLAWGALPRGAEARTGPRWR